MVICCVCKKIYKDNKVGDGIVSHGWCKDCLKLFRIMNGLKKSSSKVGHKPL